MTIAAGYVGSDGIVLCADSQFSSQEKMYRDKLIYRDFASSAACFAICGDEDHARSAIDDCCDAMRKQPRDDQDVWAVRKTVRRAIGRMLKEYDARKLEPLLRPQFLVAIATRADQSAHLFSCREAAMPEVDLYECRGSGDYIGNYIVRAFGNLHRRITCNAIIPIALHAISAAKRHDISCGGGCQFMVIRGMAASGIYSHDYDSSGDHIDVFHRWCGHVLSQIGDATLQEEDFRKELARFEEELIRMRKSILEPHSDYRRLVDICGTLPPVSREVRPNQQPTMFCPF